MDILFKNDDFVFSYRVGGILKHNGKILLQRPKNDDYAIIGGHVAAMETSMETLKREFEEELHAKIEVDNLLAIGEIYFPWGKRPCHQICLYYNVHLMDDNIPLDGVFHGYDELDNERIDLDFCWVSLEDLKVEFGRTSDIDSWMRLVRKVSWKFPGLETEQSINEHKIIVLKFMNDKRALCVKNEQDIVGVLLYSRKHNMICCLAVDPAYRKRGIASILLKEALDKLDRDKDITVSTFRENDVKGIAPRKLYKKFGFEEGELIEEFGYPNQRFVLHTDKSADNVIIGTKVTVTVDRPLGR